jgi:hypothetical protein
MGRRRRRVWSVNRRRPGLWVLVVRAPVRGQRRAPAWEHRARVVRCQAVRDGEAGPGPEVEVGGANEEDEGAARGEEEEARAALTAPGAIGSGGGSGGSDEGTVDS